MSGTKGRPPTPVTTEAEAARNAVLAYMGNHSLSKASLARLAGISPSTVGRALGEQPAREFPSLLKLRDFVVQQAKSTGSGGDSLNQAISSVDKQGAKATAQILRAIANLLDQRHPS